MQDALARDGGALELRADPTALAPERLLVFETTGSVGDFYKAVRRVPGLEFVGEQNIDGDESDEDPEHYLLMPNETSLKQMLSLWSRWQKEEKMDRGFTPWRDVFAQLRDIRAWGPSDRVSPENREVLANQIDGLNPDDLLRLEVDLVFRRNETTATKSETELVAKIEEIGGSAISIYRRSEFAYHAILADLPVRAIQEIITLNPQSLAGADPVAIIVPQSTFAFSNNEFEPDEDQTVIQYEIPEDGEPVVAVFDAVPIQAHPYLDGGMIVDDPHGLEERAVGNRIHGTAMASAALHGDLKSPLRPVNRPIYFRPVMYAPNFGDEKFDENRLVVDVICEAVERMQANRGAQVLVVNLSLGDMYRPYAGKISTWARALDYLSFRYGVLFLVSAGNDKSAFNLINVATNQEFNEMTDEEKATCVFASLNNIKADRKILSPAESMNSVTIGAWHHDSNIAPYPYPRLFVPFPNMDMPNLSSRIGLGVSNTVKPDVLFQGGREHAGLKVLSPPVGMQPHRIGNRFAGICVASQPQGLRSHGYDLGSSVATAIGTNTAARLHDLLEREYPTEFPQLPKSQKASLLKALIIHAADWKGQGEFLRSVIDPEKDMHWTHWRSEVSRFLGYGFVEPDEAIYCAENRATLWATGVLSPEEAKSYRISLPSELETVAGVREVRATLAWFSPTRPQHMTYRASKLKIAALGTPDFSKLGVGTTSDEPGWQQIEKGTVSHRRWTNNRLGDFNGQEEFSILIQREKDQGMRIDDAIAYGLAITIDHGEGQHVYEEVLESVLIKPRSLVGVRV